MLYETIAWMCEYPQMILIVLTSQCLFVLQLMVSMWPIDFYLEFDYFDFICLQEGPVFGTPDKSWKQFFSLPFTCINFFHFFRNFWPSQILAAGPVLGFSPTLVNLFDFWCGAFRLKKWKRPKYPTGSVLLTLLTVK